MAIISASSLSRDTRTPGASWQPKANKSYTVVSRERSKIMASWTYFHKIFPIPAAMNETLQFASMRHSGFQGVQIANGRFIHGFTTAFRKFLLRQKVKNVLNAKCVSCRTSHRRQKTNVVDGFHSLVPPFVVYTQIMEALNRRCICRILEWLWFISATQRYSSVWDQEVIIRVRNRIEYYIIPLGERLALRCDAAVNHDSVTLRLSAAQSRSPTLELGQTASSFA